MKNMGFRVGNKVRVKSLEWYNENKNKCGNIHCSNTVFFDSKMSKFCGSIVTIKDIDIDINAYLVKENSYYWTDDMFEGLAEDTIQPVVFENIVFPNENYADKVELCLGNDYEIVVEDGRTFVQKKKPKYPKTYGECCKILGIASSNFITIRNFYRIDGEEIITDYEDTLNDKFRVLWKLLIRRDAYWKIAGEEMGLGKPWEPDWADNYQKKWLITFYQDEINFTSGSNVQFILAFPTEEMRDAFYENFKDLIEKCKELL